MGQVLITYFLVQAAILLTAAFRRLNENWTPELVATLQKRYPELKDTRRLNMYKRRWEYMYVYMEVAYSRVWLSVHGWTFVRPVRRTQMLLALEYGILISP